MESRFKASTFCQSTKKTATQENYPVRIVREGKHFIQLPCRLSRNDLALHDKRDSSLAKCLTNNSKSFDLEFQHCGEATASSFKITAADVIQGKILLFARRDRLVSQKSWWDNLRCSSACLAVGNKEGGGSNALLEWPLVIAFASLEHILEWSFLISMNFQTPGYKATCYWYYLGFRNLCICGDSTVTVASIQACATLADAV
jgi:hypothetical protein